MGEMDDPLRLDAEIELDEIFQRLVAKYPNRKSDIDSILMAAPARKSETSIARGVKSSKGRPRTNKSVLAGWMRFLVRVTCCAEVREKHLPLARFPSKRRDFQLIAKMGLAYSITSGANPIKYPLTNPESLKRHETFLLSEDVDGGEAMAAYWSLSLRFSLYFQQPPLRQLTYCELVGDDSDNCLYGWKYCIGSHRDEPWRQGFQVSEENTRSGPTMILHFPPLKKSTWQFLRGGLRIWDNVEAKELKKNPPNKEEIAGYRKWRRNNPEIDYRKLFRQKMENHGS